MPYQSILFKFVGFNEILSSINRIKGIIKNAHKDEISV